MKRHAVMRSAVAVTGVIFGLATACTDGAYESARPDAASTDAGPGAPDGSADPGAPDAGPTVDPAATIFDESIVRTYRVTMAPADWDWLNANGYLEEYRPATVEVDGEVVANASIRFKGNAGTLYRCYDDAGNRIQSPSCAKLSVKLAFDQVDDEGKFHGLKKLNFHAMNGDPSKLHEALGYKLFRDHGVPAPRTAFANLEVNGEPIGLYAVVENVDGRFTRARFPDGGEGNLYKEIWPTEMTESRLRWALETNEDEGPSFERALRFADAVNGASDDDFAATVAAWTDLDALIGYFAVARLIDHWDDVVTFYCFGGGGCANHNYFWYESTAEDKLSLIAWDLDHTFEEPSPLRTWYGQPDWDEVDAGCEWIPLEGNAMIVAPSCDPFLRRIVTRLWDAYAASSQALLDGPFAPGAIDARIDQLEALIAPHVAADPHLDPDHWYWGVQDLRDAVDAKRAHIANKLAGPPPG